MLHNKELRIGMMLLTAAVAILSLTGLFFSPTASFLTLIMGIFMILVFGAIERYRYHKLKKLNNDLDKLLIQGIPLQIRDYEDGDLSLLANQIQKITLRLTEAADAVQKDRKLLADSLADISHQLRTPLTTMDLTTAILRDPNLSPEKRMERISELGTLLRRTEWLVETLLKLSKLDAGMVILSHERCRIQELIRKAYEPLAIPMELRNQTFSVHCGKEAFQGDITWTAEAIGNILKNCTEHTPNGGTIAVEVLETPLFLQIVISDTGPGFDSKDIPHLFDRFYKGRNAAQNSYGIGLALARNIIRAQNGTIQASNGPTGARFTIKFYKQVI